MAFALLALLLLADDPSAAPMTTAKDAPPTAVAPIDKDYLPQGAPADDYGFVAWCKGVLSGHMDLAERVQSVLPLDDAQQTIGRAYLRAYDKALAVSKESKTAEGKARADAAQADGWSRWEKARHADVQLAADTYLAYQLPARCEHAAQRLSGDKDLFKKAFSPEELEAVRSSAPSSATLATGGAPKQVEPAPVAAAPAEAAPAAVATTDASSAPIGVVSLRGRPDPFAVVAGPPPEATAPESSEAAVQEAAPASAPATEFAAAPKTDSIPTDVGGAKPLDATEAMAEAATVEKVAVIEPSAAPKTPAAEPAKAAPKPEKKAEKKPAAAKAADADEAKKAAMPSKGHLLPGFLRKKKDGA